MKPISEWTDLTAEQATTAIEAVQNRGILFRERPVENEEGQQQRYCYEHRVSGNVCKCQDDE